MHVITFLIIIINNCDRHHWIREVEIFCGYTYNFKALAMCFWFIIINDLNGQCHKILLCALSTKHNMY